MSILFAVVVRLLHQQEMSARGFIEIRPAVSVGGGVYLIAITIAMQVDT